MTYSGHLEEIIGIRWTIVSGATIMSVGVLLTSVSIQVRRKSHFRPNYLLVFLKQFLTFRFQYSVVATAITYGTMMGLGTALAYTPPLGVAMRWFPKSKGLVNGIIVGGFGLGAFIFNQIQTAYLNPNNKALDEEGKYFSDEKILTRVPSVFLMLGSIYSIIQVKKITLFEKSKLVVMTKLILLLQLLSIIVIRAPPDDEVSSMMPLVTHASPEETQSLVEIAQDSSEDDENVEKEEDEAEDLELDHPGGGNDVPINRSSTRVSQAELLENLRPGQIVKTKEFWILWSTFFLNTQAIGYINSMYKAYGQVFITDDHFLAVVGAFAAIFNAGGRVFWGHMCDKFGYRNCMCITSAFMAILYLTFGFAPSYGGKTFFAMWVWGIFFFFCANFVLLPTATAQTFGTRYVRRTTLCLNFLT